MYAQVAIFSSKKAKTCLENGSINKSLDCVVYLDRQKRKYCKKIGTTAAEETTHLVYLNKIKRLSTVEFHDEEQNAKLHEFFQRFESIKSVGRNASNKDILKI